MAKTCPHCGSSALEVEEEKSTEVCSQCGVVFKEGSFQNGTELNDSSSTRSFGVRFSDNITGQLNWRTLSWMSDAYSDGRSYQLKRRVKEQIERLHLPEDYIPQVLEMMSHIYVPTRKIEGLPRVLTPGIAGCIYIISRRNGVLIHYRNVAEASRCKYSTVLKCIRMFANYLKISMNELKQTDVLDTILTQLDVRDPLIKELAYDVDKFCSETLISEGKSQVLRSIGIVQMCIESIEGNPVDREKLKDVCRQHVCTHVNVRQSFYSIKDELVKYGKQIPWIKTLNLKNIARFTKEIISFYKDCQDHRNVDVKFEWEKKKENNDLQKESLVRNARQRVNVCQKYCHNKHPLTNDDILHKNCKFSESTRVTALEENASNGKASWGHICCPHCCGDSRCPTYKTIGRSGFCNLNHIDLIIEYLLRKGYTESQVMSGNPESMFCLEFYHSDSDGEREELDDRDISDNEMHLYIKTEPEIGQTKIHSLFMEAKEDK